MPMQYLLLLYDAVPDLAEADIREIIAGHKEFTRSLTRSGKCRDSNASEPASTATTIRVRSGRTLTIDGLFLETKEQLGGYYLIEADNLDDAISMAARVPSAKHGSVEIRPVNMAIRAEFESEGLIPQEVRR
jgi:hypothetical protein